MIACFVLDECSDINGNWVLRKRIVHIVTCYGTALDLGKRLVLICLVFILIFVCPLGLFFYIFLNIR